MRPMLTPVCTAFQWHLIQNVAAMFAAVLGPSPQNVSDLRIRRDAGVDEAAEIVT
ncbi:hypothetical protein Acsp04_38550 [Actinomadura sp. NBRC 104425]|nr:hypothetical protein Acsp04_38550 [Actinomadura sp. NBRC 104425]